MFVAYNPSLIASMEEKAFSPSQSIVEHEAHSTTLHTENRGSPGVPDSNHKRMTMSRVIESKMLFLQDGSITTRRETSQRKRFFYLEV